eukprot:TRINITY_DN2717_c1_g1_i1.p1 TRINITY_DN2717_c1_g1~~TRINITY_DN2717_c1_g1_i1.p1  ORF type:complete len:525 (+),score=154.85 TRINITY_DN2717_c1_g1_i1:71-1576(+)
MQLPFTPPRTMDPLHVIRQYSDFSDHGLSDSCPSTPESFIVTPEGKTLPAVRNIIGDDKGHLVSRFLVDKEWCPDGPSITEVPIVSLRRSPLAVPIKGLCEPNLTIKWDDHPLITWLGCKEPVCETEVCRKRKIDVFNVAADGTAHKITMLQKEYDKYKNADTEVAYVVDKDGNVRYAHSVMMPTNEGMRVVLRDDDDCGGIFDEVPTPDLVIRDHSDIVYISDMEGNVHFGSTCMLNTPEGIKQYSRCARWPVRIKRNRTPLLRYPNRKLLMPRRHDPCDVVDSFTLEAKGHSTTYNKVLLACRDKVLVSYKTDNSNDLSLTSDGVCVRLVHGTKQPILTEAHDMVCISSRQGVTFKGINILVAGPRGLHPVARVAVHGDSDTVVTKLISIGLHTMAGYHKVAGLSPVPTLCITYPKRPAIKASLKQIQEDLLYRTAPWTKPTQHCKVVVAARNQVLYTMLYPARDESVEVFIAGDEVVKGHSVISMGHGGNCSIRFVKN